MNPLKYKHVIDEKAGNEWIKEKTTGDEAVRHYVQEGPKGGKYFENRDEKKIYVTNVPHKVLVYPEDSQPTIPQEGEAYYGFGHNLSK